jgi:predicted DNA-binding WGR domain protein
MFVLLRRVDTAENMNRWYLVTIQATLLDPVAVVCLYGRRHTSGHHIWVRPAATAAEAEEIAAAIVAKRLKRGYEIVSE